MAFPPERITVKRRRDEDPVDALYFPPPKSRRTFVWNRVSAPPLSNDQEIRSAAGPPQIPTVRQEPRKFHFTRASMLARASSSVLYGGIQKTRKKQKKNLAVFVERKKDSDGSQIRVTGSLGSGETEKRLDDTISRHAAQSWSPNKRPLASPAEPIPRAETWKLSPDCKARKNPAATHVQETDTMTHSIHLASQLQKYALDVSRSENEALNSHKKAWGKFQPESPKLRPWMGHTEALNEGRHDPGHAMDFSEVQEENLDGFVFDIYVRQAEDWSGKASAGIFNTAPVATNSDKVGLLVVADEDKETWELYGNEDQSSDDGWDSEEDDENEDELDSDDEYDKDTYKPWHGAFDDENFEENTKWSENECASKAGRTSTRLQNVHGHWT
ncbi:MAG: hypothetical protein Q9173_002261 [Seirophora scorigena]